MSETATDAAAGPVTVSPYFAAGPAQPAVASPRKRPGHTAADTAATGAPAPASPRPPKKTTVAASPTKAAAAKAAKAAAALLPPLTLPPPAWETQLAAIRVMRADRSAPVDHHGCEQLADPAAPPPVQRFQVWHM